MGAQLSAAPGKRNQKSRDMVRGGMAQVERAKKDVETRKGAPVHRKEIKVSKEDAAARNRAEAAAAMANKSRKNNQPKPLLRRETLVVMMKTVAGQGSLVPTGIKNRGTKPIMVKPESGSTPIMVRPGETYNGQIDAVSTPDGRVFKVVDVYNDSVKVSDTDVEISGSKTLNNLMGGGVLQEAPDEGWELLFDAVNRETSRGN